MSDFFAFLTAVAALSIPVLSVILIIRALMKKSVKIVAIMVAICAGSIIPLTIAGVISDPSVLVVRKEEDTPRIEITSDVIGEETSETLGEQIFDGFVETTSESVVIEDVTEETKEEHKIGKRFVFQFQGSTAASYVKRFCEHPGHFYVASLFRGTPNDLSYLDVIAEYSDSDEIVWGEYYTMTATIVHGDYDYFKTRINCEVQSDDIIVYFSVEFRGEFEEAVGLLTEGDQVVFRGRFYDEGCGFTDCELITE